METEAQLNTAGRRPVADAIGGLDLEPAVASEAGVGLGSGSTLDMLQAPARKYQAA
jgi:hypothetical protein